MDALVASFVAAFLGEWGGRTQLLVAALGVRAGRPGAALAGVAAAILVATLLAGVAGGALVGVMPPRAAGLLLAIALVAGGLAGLLRPRPPGLGSRLPLLAVAIILGLAAQLGSAAPFITFALAARFDAPLLAAAGGTAGALAACAPAALLGGALAKAPPFRAIRMVGAALFLIAGAALALSALRLV
jgi:Ca2+/H+ antiporter, TMEM165/GDT1 family